MSKEYSQIPRVAFSILLALSLKDRHGYEIIKQIDEDSQGKIKIGPGALYTSIRKLRDQGMIKEIEQSENKDRRYYSLTAQGAKTLAAELEYYENALALARRRQILHTI